MFKEEIYIKETTQADFSDIMMVEEIAFGSTKEAELTADLIADHSAKPILSLLAFHKEKPIGHILFTRAYITEMKEQPLFHILAPLAVIPEYQKQGIGGLLIKDGLKRLKKMGSKMVLVLGHIEYYPKYGFVPDANKLGYAPTYRIPEKFANAWMVQSLTSNGLLEIEKGKVVCCKKLNEPEHWQE